jgi:hypothetical protein
MSSLVANVLVTDFSSEFARAASRPRASAAVRPSKEEIIVLSPFGADESKDIGYRALNTGSGGGLNTKLEDKAASVSVFTKLFLNDSGSAIREAMPRYSVGVVNHKQDTNPVRDT